MNETKEELIDFIKSLIRKRFEDNKSCLAINLVGSIARYHPFKAWLQTNYKPISVLKIMVLKFITEETEHFSYDFKTGSVSLLTTDLPESDDQIIPTLLLKPKLFLKLETKPSFESFDDNLLVFELILFLFGEVSDKSVMISDLLVIIEQKCGKQFMSYKAMIGFEDRIPRKTSKSVLDMNYKNENILLKLISKKMYPFFAVDLQKNITINTSNVELSKLLECFTKTGVILMKNLLTTYLYRFGRKTLNELNEWLESRFKIGFEFVVNQRKASLDQIIGWHSNELIVCNNGSIGVNPEIIGKTRCLELDLMYEFGKELTEISGVVVDVRPDFAVIEAISHYHLKTITFKPKLRVRPEMVTIYGQHVFDLNVFIHSGDRLSFDMTFVTKIGKFAESFQNLIKDLWFVTRIYNIRHSANCFVDTIYEWNQTMDFGCDSLSDSDDSSSESNARCD